MKTRFYVCVVCSYRVRVVARCSSLLRIRGAIDLNLSSMFLCVECVCRPKLICLCCCIVLSCIARICLWHVFPLFWFLLAIPIWRYAFPTLLRRLKSKLYFYVSSHLFVWFFIAHFYGVLTDVQVWRCTFCCSLQVFLRSLVVIMMLSGCSYDVVDLMVVHGLILGIWKLSFCVVLLVCTLFLNKQLCSMRGVRIELEFRLMVLFFLTPLLSMLVPLWLFGWCTFIAFELRILCFALFVMYVLALKRSFCSLSYFHVFLYA